MRSNCAQGARLFRAWGELVRLQADRTDIRGRSRRRCFACRWREQACGRCARVERMVADGELAGVVGDDDGLAEQALGLDRPPQRRFAGRANRIGRHSEIGEAEGAQVVHPLLARRKDERGMADGLVDGLLRQIGAAHVGDRRPVDEVAARRRARPRKAKRDLPGPGRNAVNRSEPSGWRSRTCRRGAPRRRRRRRRASRQAPPAAPLRPQRRMSRAWRSPAAPLALGDRQAQAGLSSRGAANV